MNNPDFQWLTDLANKMQDPTDSTVIEFTVEDDSHNNRGVFDGEGIFYECPKAWIGKTFREVV